MSQIPQIKREIAKACKTAKANPTLWLLSLLAAALLLASIVFICGCTTQPSTGEPSPGLSPPIEPATQGYVRGYDYKLNCGFDYPEGWEMQLPQVESPYEKVEVFTRKGTPAKIEVIVKSANVTNLEGFRQFIDTESILEEGFITIGGRRDWEAVYQRLPDEKVRYVAFLVHSREYSVRCTTSDESYTQFEDIFDHVINSFVIGE